MNPLYETKLNLPLLARGKVRDIYEIDSSRILVVTTDRLSAFDIVLDEPINQKGSVLTAISNFWFHKTRHIINHHLTGESLDTVLSDAEIRQVSDRAVIVKKMKPLPVEAIVRGYLIGSGWRDYQNTGLICGIKLPANLSLAEQLPNVIYTPSTKAKALEHDENISFEKTSTLLGKSLADKVHKISLELYQYATDFALKRGIIIADTKFEFGLDNENNLVLIDELLTPDSSRFWSKEAYQIGKSPDSFDKQIVRDYLENCNWDKKPPAPKLPASIIQKTTNRYLQIQRLLCQ